MKRKLCYLSVVVLLTTLFYSSPLTAKEEVVRPDCYAKIAWCTFFGGLTIKCTNVATADLCRAYECQLCEGVGDPE
ncbi:hypothetical protein ACV07N_11890 [Roseivirga echinicomitans]